MPRSWLPRHFFRDTAVVYTRTGRGAFSTVANTALACRVEHVNVQPATSGAERATLSAIRTMLWDADYYMPEGAQVLVSAVRWQTVAGTFKAPKGPLDDVLHRQCDLERVTAPV